MTTQFDETLLQDLDSFIQNYQFTDDKEIYTNGSELIQVSRVKQWFAYNNKQKGLEEENKKLKAELDNVNVSKDNYIKLINKVGELTEKIDKAIRTLKVLKGSARWERHLYEIDDLIEILKGEENERKN